MGSMLEKSRVIRSAGMASSLTTALRNHCRKSQGDRGTSPLKVCSHRTPSTDPRVPTGTAHSVLQLSSRLTTRFHHRRKQFWGESFKWILLVLQKNWMKYSYLRYALRQIYLTDHKHVRLMMAKSSFSGGIL